MIIPVPKMPAPGSHAHSVLKAISWRFVASADTFLIAFIVTGHVAGAAGIAGFEVFTKMAIYYGHERLWTWLSGGKVAPAGSSPAH